jgi:hypothetical protein
MEGKVEFQQAFAIIVIELRRGGLNFNRFFFHNGDWVKEGKERILI